MFKFYLTVSNIKAEGYFSEGKFVLLKGSKVRKEISPSFPKALIDKRINLINSGILLSNDNFYILSEVYKFNSPSEASNLVTGTSSSGPLCWKVGSGKTLKSILRKNEINSV